MGGSLLGHFHPFPRLEAVLEDVLLALVEVEPVRPLVDLRL